MSTQYETQGYTINNAGRRLVVDPITRIEGHMRCEVNINDQNVITNAVSCGTMFRGLEIILQGRDPRDAWAFVERICGVCTGVHALASVYAIEDAIGIKVPDNANIIRNIMLATLWCHDHLVHFYQLAGMDWIDVLDALKAENMEVEENVTNGTLLSGEPITMIERTTKSNSDGLIYYYSSVYVKIGNDVYSANCGYSGSAKDESFNLMDIVSSNLVIK